MQRVADARAAAVMEGYPRRARRRVEERVQDRPVGDRVRAVAHALRLAERRRDGAGLEVVATDHDGRRELAPLHQIVQRAAEARPLSLAQPTDARRQALERYASLRQRDPPAQVVVLREQLQRQPVGALQVPRLARQRDPAERPPPLAEQRPDVLGYESRDLERLLEPGVGGLSADVVAVVERDGAPPL